MIARALAKDPRRAIRTGRLRGGRRRSAGRLASASRRERPRALPRSDLSDSRDLPELRRLAELASRRYANPAPDIEAELAALVEPHADERTQPLFTGRGALGRPAPQVPESSRRLRQRSAPAGRPARRSRLRFVTAGARHRRPPAHGRGPGGLGGRVPATPAPGAAAPVVPAADRAARGQAEPRASPRPGGLPPRARRPLDPLRGSAPQRRRARLCRSQARLGPELGRRARGERTPASLRLGRDGARSARARRPRRRGRGRLGRQAVEASGSGARSRRIRRDGCVASSAGC